MGCLLLAYHNVAVLRITNCCVATSPLKKSGVFEVSASSPPYTQCEKIWWYLYFVLHTNLHLSRPHCLCLFLYPSFTRRRDFDARGVIEVIFAADRRLLKRTFVQDVVSSLCLSILPWILLRNKIDSSIVLHNIYFLESFMSCDLSRPAAILLWCVTTTYQSPWPAALSREAMFAAVGERTFKKWPDDTTTNLTKPV